MNLRRTVWIGMLLGAAAALGEAEMPPMAVWDVTARLGGSVGYRDNVLRSSVVKESSAFFMSEAEASVMRLSDTDAFFLLYFFGEDIRYADAPTVNYEQLFSIAAQGSVPTGDPHEIGAEMNYLYQHQIYDVSETQATQRRVLVLGHSATLRPYWTYALNEAWSTKAEASFFRQIYEVELDDYSEGAGQISLIYSYGNRSEALIYYEGMQRYYDTREQADDSGVIDPGTDLVYRQHEGGLRLKHYWDQNRRWRTLTTFSAMLNRDNGSGYFDYDRTLLRQQVRWKNSRWTLSGNVRCGWYQYKMQQVDDERRKRSYVSLDIRTEYRIGKRGILFASGEREWNRSNDPLDEYNDWMVHAGAALDF